jgi:cytochrome c553
MKTKGMNLLKSTIGVLMVIILYSCTYHENEPIKIPKPRVPQETLDVETAYVSNITPNTINSPYWLTSDFKVVTLKDVTTKQVSNEVGLLNVNGTYNGLSDFSEGTNLNLEIKAAYDDENLYLLASWKDESFNPSQHSWLFNGPKDPLKTESADGWTSQRSDDNIIIEFDMDNGSSDVWKWSLALSEPLGYAIDMINDGTSTTSDTGDKTFLRNVEGTGNNAGPKYEWSGAQQDLDRDPAGFTLLDAGFYLLNKTPFTGDPTNGAAVYQKECAACHGVEGDGNGFEFNTGYSMIIPGFLNRFSREGFASAVLSSSHDGSGHFEILSATERDDLMAMVRGFTGVPGYYLENPTGSNSDVQTVSNVPLAKINTRAKNEDGYKVLFIRKLTTGNSDDIQIADPESVAISFNVYLTNGDDVNMVGSVNETLTFKAK